MPKLNCVCGKVTNLSPVPNEHGFVMIWEPQYELLVEQLSLVHQEAVSAEDFKRRTHTVFALSDFNILQAYECEYCGRLAVFLNVSDPNPPIWFAREDGYPSKDTLLAALASQYKSQMAR